MARLPRTRAAALRYQPQAPFLDAAPRLVAKGDGLLAERILALAREHGIPVEQDPDLLAALEPLQVDRVIPPELFKAVAVMLASLYRANGQAGRKPFGLP
jgi:flagellar biosynthesis protein